MAAILDQAAEEEYLALVRPSRMPYHASVPHGSFPHSSPHHDARFTGALILRRLLRVAS